MPERYPLTVHVPVNGKVFIRLDGVPGEHEVGSFTQNIPVEFATGPGEVAFTFDPAFWEGAIQNKMRGVEPPTPPAPDWDKSTYNIVLKVLRENALQPSEVLAETVLNALGSEGRLSA